MESLVKNENFVVIQGWMVNILKLKNNELTIYAIIYGFSQTTGNEFTGSLQYLADWCGGATKQGVIKCLKSLCEKDLIIKKVSYNNNVKSCAYSINYNKLSQFNSIKQSLIGPSKQSLIGPSKQSLTNNIENNNIENNNLYLKNDFNKSDFSQKKNKEKINPLPPNKKDFTKQSIERNFCNPIEVAANINDIDWDGEVH